VSWHEPLLALSPEILLTLTAALLPLGIATVNRRGLIAGVTAAILLVAAFLVLGTVYTLPGLGWLPQGPYVAYGALEVDAFSAFFKLVFIGVALLVVLGSPGYFRERHQPEYYALLLFATVGMMVVASANDLITLFVGFELASFSTYALAGFFKRAGDSNEAALKYFIVGSLSSALTLFGISIVYGITGDVSFNGLAQHAATIAGELGQPGKIDRIPVLDLFAILFLLAGFGFKVAMVPFHMWAPDTYDGAPTTVSAFLAAGSKKLGFVALFKVFLVGLAALKVVNVGAWYGWEIYLTLLAIVTMTVGNLMALRQDNLKRMLAYSSVAHAGYMLIAIAAAVLATNDPALRAATTYLIAGGLFHIVTHAIMKSGAFLAIAGVSSAGIGENIEGWRGLGRRAPFVAFAMAVFMLSFAGIPPLAGFASKFVLFSGAVQTYQLTSNGWFLALVIAGILNSGLSLYYYARVVRVMYVDDAETATTPMPRLKVPLSTTIAVGACLVGVLLIGLWWTPVIDFSLDAAGALMATGP